MQIPFSNDILLFFKLTRIIMLLQLFILQAFLVAVLTKRFLISCVVHLALFRAAKITAKYTGKQAKCIQ